MVDGAKYETQTTTSEKTRKKERNSRIAFNIFELVADKVRTK